MPRLEAARRKLLDLPSCWHYGMLYIGTHSNNCIGNCSVGTSGMLSVHIVCVMYHLWPGRNTCVRTCVCLWVCVCVRVCVARAKRVGARVCAFVCERMFIVPPPMATKVGGDVSRLWASRARSCRAASCYRGELRGFLLVFCDASRGDRCGRFIGSFECIGFQYLYFTLFRFLGRGICLRVVCGSM